MADTPMHEIEQCPACGETRCIPNPDELRALRESHDALVEALKAQGEMSGAFWHVRACNATPWLYEHCAFYCVEARAALAKAEALHG